MAPTQTIAIDPVPFRTRAAVYRLLGRLWLREVDADLLASLGSSPLNASFVAAGGTLPGPGSEFDRLEVLATDYCQLFVGPSGHLPPHQSVWGSGHFQGEATVSMRRELEAHSLPQPDGMADHLGEQLAAMAVIIERLAAQPAAEIAQLDAARDFFARHLAWTDELCRQATSRAQTDFYRSLMTMTQDFLQEERRAWLVGEA